MKNFSWIILMSLLFFACDKNAGFGKRPGFDNNQHIFSNSTKDTVLIAKNKVEWWFSELVVNGKPLDFHDGSIKYYTKNAPEGAQNILWYIYKFEGEWFTVEKIDEQQIKISISANTNSSPRNLSFKANVGNAADNISLTQMP